MNQRRSIEDILDKKKRQEKITMLTAYDYPFASLIDEAGIDMILVGDSLANVVLGLQSTKEVGMAEMLHHAKAVNRAVKRALVIGEPFMAWEDVLQAGVGVDVLALLEPVQVLLIATVRYVHPGLDAFMVPADPELARVGVD